jgi:hypothetical protein
MALMGGVGATGVTPARKLATVALLLAFVLDGNAPLPITVK